MMNLRPIPAAASSPGTTARPRQPWRRTTLAAASLAALAALPGCQSRQPPPLAPLAQPPAAASGIASARVSGAVDAANPSAGSAPIVALGHGQGRVRVPADNAGAGGDITLNFVDTDVRDIAKTVLGTILSVPYTIDPAVHGQVTISTPRPVSRAQVLKILDTLLSQANATVVEANGLYQVLPLSTAAVKPMMGGVGGGEGGADIVQLRYASAKDLLKILEPFVSHGGKVISEPNRNALIVSGDPLARSTLVDLIHAFDVDVLAGQSYALFPVNSGTPTKVAAELQKMLLADSDHALSGQVRVIPMPRVNAVLVASPQPHFIEDARRLLVLVDRAGLQSAPSWHVYYVQNGQSSDLEYLLQRAFTPWNVTSSGQSDTNRLGNNAPGLNATTVGSGGGTGVGGSTGIGGGTGIGGSGGGIGTQTAGIAGGSNGDQQGQAASSTHDANVPGLTDPLAAATQPLSQPSGEAQDESQNRVRIIANRKNNALLIYAPPAEWEVIEAMLQKIDIVPLQVEIEAMVAEVTLNNTLQYGTQFYFQNGGLTGTLSNAATAAFTGQFPGFVLNKSSGLKFAISALQSVTNLKVLSAPDITVLDNELATIQVGDDVPYTSQTAVSTETTGAPIVNSVSYQQTGIILNVIPRVNSGGLVTLDLSQEVSEPVTTSSSSIDSPTFQDRKVQSRVVVEDGQTIGMAGLISDSNTEGNSGIPVLKDIPLLGSLFGSQSNVRARTELLVLITPHVIYDQRGARMLTEDLRNQVVNAGRVPGELQTMPVGGDANPNAALSR